MTLNLQNKDDFVKYFLSPIGSINNSAIVNIGTDGLVSLVSGDDKTIILYAKYDTSMEVDDNVSLSLPDLGRFVKILQCIEGPGVSLDVEDNNISYRSSDMRFKYHLLEDGILSQPPISVDKINSLQFDTVFELKRSSFLNLIKSSTFAVNLNKVYFLTKDGCVFADIDDKQAHNVDSVCIKLCDEFTGAPIVDPLPISFDTIRRLSTLRSTAVVVSINTKLNVMSFRVNNNGIHMNYIISGLAK